MAIQAPSMQELLEAGVHFGHKVSRGHPKMNQYIYGARDGVHIIDLAKAEEKLKEALDYVYEVGRSGKILLVVGTKKQAREIIEGLAKEAGVPYLTSRWLGGILTNFDEVRKNINKLIALKKEQDSGQLTRYTKKEQLLIARKLEKFANQLGGVVAMDKMPDVMFVVDIVTEDTAVREARRMELPIVGIADTNSDPNQLDYAIPANDDGIKSIKLLCEAVINTYSNGKKLGDKVRVEEAAAEEVKVQAEKEAKETEARNEKEKAARKKDVGEKPAIGLAAETQVIEEAVEKEIVAESERKTA